MNQESEPLTIDIVSDVVCPWCYLGEKRLEAALADECCNRSRCVRWRPYRKLRHPTIPHRGLDRLRGILGEKNSAGTVDSRRSTTISCASAARTWAFLSPSTRSSALRTRIDAHSLTRWALSAGEQGKVVDSLYKAYFVEGRDIGDRSVLIDIASECGLEAKLVEKLLSEGADIDLVREEIAQAQAIGVSGVPFFIFAGRLGVPGAQEVSVLRRALAQARQAMMERTNEAPAA